MSKSKSELHEESGDTSLSEDDVRNEMKLIAMLPEKFTNEIFVSYSQCINSILALVLKQCDDDEEAVDIEQFRRVLQMCPLEEKFIRTKGKVWVSRHHIINKNAVYFLNKDYSKLIKRDGNQALIESLMEIVKARYGEISTSNQEMYWSKAAKLLNIVARFRKAMSELRKK
jgi:hypothetical protein